MRARPQTRRFKILRTVAGRKDVEIKMNILKAVSETADMRKIFSYYGYRPDSRGFIKCPFHNEKTASMNLYADNTRWHCFGCGADGDSIDFVKKIEGTGVWNAAEKVNEICSLGFAANKKEMTLGQIGYIMEINKKYEKRTKKKKEEEKNAENLLAAYCAVDRIISACMPNEFCDEISETYADALKKEPFYAYCLEAEVCDEEKN